MKTKRRSLIKVAVMLCCLFMITACDRSENAGKGEVEFEITDAPSDDAKVQGVFITVTDVQVNGKSIAGFSGKQTINLKTYQEGLTKFLGSAELESRTYSNLSLVLDLDEDSNGNFPGCYVMAENVKYKLATTASGLAMIAISKAWSVREGVTTHVVLDVDLRKAIRYSDDPELRYTFASTADLQSSIRLITREKTGTIKGTISGELNPAEEVIVYAYKKGTFNAETETQMNGGLMFRTAVNSAKVKAGILSNTYTLAFMEEGEYELIFAAYAKDSTTGVYSLQTVLDTEVEGNGSINNVIKVNAGVALNVSATANGSI